MKDFSGKTAATSPRPPTGASLEGPLPGDPFLVVGNLDLRAAGYVREEWFLEGTAQAYRLSGERRADATAACLERGKLCGLREGK
jgi:hypothetical protein